MSIQHKRKESLFFKHISQIISEDITNSNISYTTVTDVSLSNDGSVLKVYVTFEKNIQKSLENLKKTSGFIKKQLSKTSISRKIPEIVFKIDDTFEKANKIEQILKEIKKK